MLVKPNRLKPKTTTFCGFAKHFLNAIVILIILLREILSTGKESVNVNFVMMHTRRPRGGQLGREKLRRKFLRTVARAPGMLLLKNQFPDSFQCLSLIGHTPKRSAQAEASAFVIFLYVGVYPRTRSFAVPVWLVLENFLREESSLKMKPTKPTIFQPPARFPVQIFY